MEKGPNASIGAQRLFVWLAIAGALAFAVAWVGLMGFFPPPPADLPAEQVAALYSVHNVRFKIGVVLALIAGGFLVPLSIVISVQMARLEKGVPVWAILQGLAGAIGSAFIWLPTVAWAVFWSTLAWAAMGLGVLTKGPVALLVPLAGVLPWALWRRRARRMVAGGAPLVLAVLGAPWVWVVSRADPDFLHYALVT